MQTGSSFKKIGLNRKMYERVPQFDLFKYVSVAIFDMSNVPLIGVQFNLIHLYKFVAVFQCKTVEFNSINTVVFVLLNSSLALDLFYVLQ